MSSSFDGGQDRSAPIEPDSSVMVVLSRREFLSLSPEDQREVNETGRRLLKKYGKDWLRKHAPRLKAEIELAYDFPGPGEVSPNP